jgi:hypothetical protein
MLALAYLETDVLMLRVFSAGGIALSVLFQVSQLMCRINRVHQPCAPVQSPLQRLPAPAHTFVLSLAVRNCSCSLS